VLEADWQEQVVHLATLAGWLCYHTHDSRHSVAGFPDLVLVRAPRLVFAELKVDPPTSKRGRPTPVQERWLGTLRGVPSVEVYVWRPPDLEAVALCLGLSVREVPGLSRSWPARWSRK
jgi:hypothetical protein